MLPRLIIKFCLESLNYRKRLLRNIIAKSLSIFFVAMFTTSILLAQNSQTEIEPKINDKLLVCDESVALQDIVVTEALTKLKENSVLFVVVSQGTSENSDKLLQQRLYNVRQYFRDRGNRLSREKIIIVIGQAVSENGRLEYYINGQLVLRLLYPKDGFICHRCCGPDEDYYPDKEFYKKKQKRSYKGRKGG